MQCFGLMNSECGPRFRCMSPGFESNMWRLEMCQQESAEDEISIVNRERNREDIVPNEVEMRLICTSLSDIRLGSLQSNGALWAQYQIYQACRPARPTAEVQRKLKMSAAALGPHFIEQVTGLRFVHFREAAQSSARLHIVAKRVIHAEVAWG